MKLIALQVALALIIGCTTLTPVEMRPEQLRKSIIAGDILEAGDRAKLTTDDGKEHRIKVTLVTLDEVIAKNEAIPIDDIVAVETREYNRGKTTALGATTIVVVYVVLSAAATVALVGAL